MIYTCRWPGCKTQRSEIGAPWGCSYHEAVVPQSMITRYRNAPTASRKASVSLELSEWAMAYNKRNKIGVNA